MIFSYASVRRVMKNVADRQQIDNERLWKIAQRVAPMELRSLLLVTWGAFLGTEVHQ
jgi:hypothetical protein